MPDDDLNEMLDRCDGDIFNSAGTELYQRKSLRLITGQFADKIAIVETLDDKARVRVVLDILGRPTPRTVRSSNLAAATLELAASVALRAPAALVTRPAMTGQRRSRTLDLIGGVHAMTNRAPSDHVVNCTTNI